jgi:hypothetical protein
MSPRENLTLDDCRLSAGRGEGEEPDIVTSNFSSSSSFLILSLLFESWVTIKIGKLVQKEWMNTCDSCLSYHYRCCLLLEP